MKKEFVTLNLHQGDIPLVATAIHDGHALTDDVREIIALSEEERLREEDPFAGLWTTVADKKIIAHYSRFQVDLNRPREKARNGILPLTCFAIGDRAFFRSG